MTSYRKAILYGPGDLRIEEDALDTSNLAPDAVSYTHLRAHET